VVSVGRELRAGDARHGAVAVAAARGRRCPGRARRGCWSYFTARQVIVLKTPSIFGILSTISEPIELTSGASHTAITSYSPVMASAAEMPDRPSIFLATTSARPGDALMSTYAFIAEPATVLLDGTGSDYSACDDYFGRRLSARCWASFFSPGLTATTFGPRTFLSRALLRALSRGATRSSSSPTS